MPSIMYDEPSEKTVYKTEELLTMEEVMQLASSALTEGITFEITKIQLYYAYGTVRAERDDVYPLYTFIEPSWQFVMPANASAYTRIVVDVSAVNREVMVRYE